MAEYQVAIATDKQAKRNAWSQAENSLHALITVSLGDTRITPEALVQLQKHRKRADKIAKSQYVQNV